MVNNDFDFLSIDIGGPTGNFVTQGFSHGFIKDYYPNGLSLTVGTSASFTGTIATNTLTTSATTGTIAIGQLVDREWRNSSHHHCRQRNHVDHQRIAADGRSRGDG